MNASDRSLLILPRPDLESRLRIDEGRGEPSFALRAFPSTNCDTFCAPPTGTLVHRRRDPRGPISVEEPQKARRKK